jgi:hypothetical protein
MLQKSRLGQTLRILRFVELSPSSFFSIFYSTIYLQYTDIADLMSNKEIQRLLSIEIAQASTVMKNFERPSRWVYTLEPFSQENQMLTPKMSMRRNNILAAYLPLIEKAYEDTAGVSLADFANVSDQPLGPAQD